MMFSSSNDEQRFDEPSPASGKTYRRLSTWFTTGLDRLVKSEHLIMMLLAIIIGTLAGLGAVGVRALIREISHFFFQGEGTLLENIAAAPWYLKLMIPTLGGLIVGPIIYRFAPEARGTGVPEVMQSVLLRGGQIRPRVALLKTVVSTISIGTGGSVGREGPIIQIGSSLGSTVAQFFNIPAKRMKTLVGCGAAAGIAAAFNAPVAGALFAIEIILMDYAVAQFSPIVISSVMATVISHAFEGDFPAIEMVGDHALHSFWEVGLYMILGGLAGLAAWLFIKSVYSLQDRWDSWKRIPEWFKPAVGGAMIGVMGLVFPQVMGVGYDSINLTLNHEALSYMGLGSEWINHILGNQAFWIMALLLVVMKIYATSITLGSGGSGGIFAPSLFIGAMLGGFFGHFVHLAFPESTASAGTYALIAMGGLVAGTTRAPITAIITIFELTKEVSIILPVMTTCILSTLVSSKLSSESIYTMKLLRRKIHVSGHAEINIMKDLQVRDIYSTNFVSLPQTTNFDEVVMTLVARQTPFVSVHRDRNDEFIGVVPAETIKDQMFEKESLRHLLIAGDIADRSIEHVHLDQSCATALKRMRRCGFNVLPVVASEDHKKQIGIIRLQDIVDAYDREIQRIDMTSDLADRIMMSNIGKDVRFLEGYAVSEVRVPHSFVGKSIAELQVRTRCGVDILTIKHAGHSHKAIEAIPSPDHVFLDDETLVVAGRTEDIERLKYAE